jgi:hypothetical protein
MALRYSANSDYIKTDYKKINALAGSLSLATHPAPLRQLARLPLVVTTRIFHH